MFTVDTILSAAVVVVGAGTRCGGFMGVSAEEVYSIGVSVSGFDVVHAWCVVRNECIEVCGSVDALGDEFGVRCESTGTDGDIVCCGGRVGAVEC